MKKYKVLLLLVLPVLITLIFLSFNESKVYNDRLTYPILNSRVASTLDYIRHENQKLVPNMDLVIACQIQMRRNGNHINDTASVIFCAVSIQDCNPVIGLKAFNEKISITNVFFTKKNLNCFSRIVICKDSSGNLTSKIKFSF